MHRDLDISTQDLYEAKFVLRIGEFPSNCGRIPRLSIASQSVSLHDDPSNALCASGNKKACLLCKLMVQWDCQVILSISLLRLDRLLQSVAKMQLHSDFHWLIFELRSRGVQHLDVHGVFPSPSFTLQPSQDLRISSTKGGLRSPALCRFWRCQQKHPMILTTGLRALSGSLDEQYEHLATA